MRDRSGAVVRMFAGIVVEDGAEPAGELVQEQGIDLVGRGDSRDEEERRALAQDAIGHPVSGAIPAADLGLRVVAGRLPRETRGAARGIGGRPASRSAGSVAASSLIGQLRASVSVVGRTGALDGMEHHAREAHAAGPAVVDGLVVIEQAAPGRADRVQHRISGGQAADAPAVADARGRAEPAAAGRRPRLGRASSRRTSRTCSWSPGSTGLGSPNSGPT